MTKYTFRLDVVTPQHGVSKKDLDYVLATSHRVVIACMAIYIGYSAARAFDIACSAAKHAEISDIIHVSFELGYDEKVGRHHSRVIQIVTKDKDTK